MADKIIEKIEALSQESDKITKQISIIDQQRLELDQNRNNLVARLIEIRGAVKELNSLKPVEEKK